MFRSLVITVLLAIASLSVVLAYRSRNAKGSDSPNPTYIRRRALRRMSYARG
jgi:hypothetical protein